MLPLPASPAAPRAPRPRGPKLAPYWGAPQLSGPLPWCGDGKTVDPGHVGTGKGSGTSTQLSHSPGGGHVLQTGAPGAQPPVLTPPQAPAEAWASGVHRVHTCRYVSVLVLGHRACEMRAWEEASLPTAGPAQRQQMSMNEDHWLLGYPLGCPLQLSIKQITVLCTWCAAVPGDPTLRPRDPCLLDLRTENRQETLLPGKCQASPASGSMAFPQRTGDPECGVSVQREKEIGFQLIHFSSRLGLH